MRLDSSRILKSLALTSAFLFSSLVAHAATDVRFAKWSAPLTPTEGPARIHGSYSAGCIEGAIRLMPDPSYRLIRASSGLHHGHPLAIRYVQRLASEIARRGLPPVGVEDISGPRGGPVVAGHLSHQTGLDIDISLELLDLSEAEVETHVSKSFVESSNVRRLKTNWDPNLQDVLIATAADSFDVEKIFVAPAIKKHFCEKYPDAPWLFKLRAFDGHDDHIHVRLKPPGHGSTSHGTGPKQCGADLDDSFRGWYVTLESDRLHPYVPSHFPVLPKACSAILLK
ncbi:MAG: penicillin-insensitive murein endopeptidase [Bdellovibrionota bacterium]